VAHLEKSILDLEVGYQRPQLVRAQLRGTALD
jgi:hypothetical protein